MLGVERKRVGTTLQSVIFMEHNENIVNEHCCVNPRSALRRE
jgi:hypothetical protein